MNEEQEKIVLENEKLIYLVLKKLKLYNKKEDYYDLGMIGLVKAARTYDNTKKTKLSTYLTKCITNEILQYLRKKRPQTISLNTIVYDENNNLYLEDCLPDNKVNIEQQIDQKIEFEKVNELIKKLPYKEQLIINHLFNINGYEYKTQEELGIMFKITQAQICRIKNKIINEIKDNVNKN